MLSQRILRAGLLLRQQSRQLQTRTPVLSRLPPSLITRDIRFPRFSTLRRSSPEDRFSHTCIRRSLLSISRAESFSSVPVPPPVMEKSGESKKADGIPEPPSTGGQREKGRGDTEGNPFNDYWEVFAAFFVTVAVIMVIHDELFSVSSVDGRSMYPALHPKDRIMFTRLNKADPKPGDVLVMKSPHQAHARIVKRLIALPGDLVFIDHDHMQRSRAAYMRSGTTFGGLSMDIRRLELEVEHGDFPTADASSPSSPLPSSLSSLSSSSSPSTAATGVSETSSSPAEGFIGGGTANEPEMLPRPRWYRIPPGQCWIEGDNGQNSLDSHMYGPVPLSLVEGIAKYVWWPPSRMQKIQSGPKPRCHVLISTAQSPQ